MRFIILNIRQTGSEEQKPAGAISKKHVHTPNVQYGLISLEDFLFIILTISGIFHKGSIIAAINAIFSIIPLLLLFLPSYHNHILSFGSFVATLPIR
ncbi:MAG: hypothetical protein KKC11_05950 [Candidatus Omnitrophica bacterium]|nr:hypothetical protein [Candidatus Omnitrophota bacterium]MBU0897137.1 hypothetical protein [Candidatus Omnitrophota bacterium]MBU1809893.1 hypothetical protein [Candidatus Omnitrophota bacterium]